MMMMMVMMMIIRPRRRRLDMEQSERVGPNPEQHDLTNLTSYIS